MEYDNGRVKNFSRNIVSDGVSNEWRKEGRMMQLVVVVFSFVVVAVFVVAESKLERNSVGKSLVSLFAVLFREPTCFARDLRLVVSSAIPLK